MGGKKEDGCVGRELFKFVYPPSVKGLFRLKHDSHHYLDVIVWLFPISSRKRTWAYGNVTITNLREMKNNKIDFS